jgi:hypothetical protein
MRALRALLIVLVILAGIFVAGDRLAVHYAEGRIADTVKESSAEIEGRPQVSIKGFPFLTQVLSKKLTEVDVSVGTVRATAQGHAVRVNDVRGTFSDVTVSSTFSSATAGTAHGSAVIPYSAMDAALPKGVTVSYAGAQRAAKGQVKLSGKLTDALAAAGIPVAEPVASMVDGRTLSAYATVSLPGTDTLRLRAGSVSGLPDIPGLSDEVSKVVDQDLQLAGIPATVKLSTVRAESDGLHFSGSGTDVVLTG